MPDIFDTINTQIETPSDNITSVNLSNISKGTQGSIFDKPTFAPQGLDTKYAPLTTFDAERLAPIENYNSFSEQPRFNPEATDIQNQRDYAFRQGKLEYAKNLGVKLLDSAAGAFTNNFKQHTRNISALMDLDPDKLATNEQEDQKRLDNLYPTMGSGENQDSFLRYLPFASGSGDFYGSAIPSLGFSLGTIGATVLENAVLAATTEGLGNLAASAKTASSVALAMDRLYEGFTGAKSLQKGLQVLNNVDKEFNVLSSVKSGMKSLLNYYQTYNTAASEAAFEGTTSYVDTKQKLIDDFTNKNGYQPYGSDLQTIEQKAKDAKLATFTMNLPVLLASNLIQFDNIMKPYKVAENQALNLGVLDNLTIGKVYKPLVKFETTSAQKVWDFTQKASTSATKFLKGAASEGLEEVAQGSIQAYNKAYYSALTNEDPSQLAMKALGQYTFSKQYWDEFLGGALGGSIFQGAGYVASLFNGNKKKSEEQATTTLNSTPISSVIQEGLLNRTVDKDAMNLKQQSYNAQQLDKATINKDILLYKDIQDKAFNEFALTAAQTGKLSLRREQLELAKEMTGELFEQQTSLPYNQENKEAVDQVIDEHLDRLDDFERDYAIVQNTYKNPYTFVNSPDNEAQNIAFNAFELAKRNRLFVRQAVQRDKQRQESIFANLSTQTENTIDRPLLTKLFDKTQREKYVKDLNDYLDTYAKATVVDDFTRNTVEQTKKQIGLINKFNQDLTKGIVNYEDVYKAADLIYETSVAESLGRDSNLLPKLDTFDKPSIIKNIADAFILEARNKQNVTDYNILQQRVGFDTLVQKHVEAIKKFIEEDKPQATPTKTETPKTEPKEKPKVVETVDNNIIEEETDKELEKDYNTDEKNGPKKSVEVAYRSSVVVYDEQLNEKNTLDNQFHRRTNLFLERLSEGNLPKGKTTFWKQSEIKVLHLTNNTFQNYGKGFESLFNDLSDVDMTNILQLFVHEKDGKLYPIGVDGNLLNPLSVNEEYDIKSLTYTYLAPSREDYYIDGEQAAPNYRISERISHKDALTKHRTIREGLLNNKNVLLPFDVSNGLPNTFKEDRTTVRNNVVDTNLIAQKDIDSTSIEIPTSMDEYSQVTVRNGEQRFLKKGMPYLKVLSKDKETIDYVRLLNRKLTPSEVSLSDNLLKDVLKKAIANNFTVSKTSDEYKFLSTLLHLDLKNPTKKEQISITKEDNALVLTYSFDLPQRFIINSLEDVDNIDLTSWLSERFINVKNPKLFKGEFTEVFEKNGKLQTRSWPSYNNYLLSPTLPKKGSRPSAKREDIPLSINLYTPQQVQDSYEGGNDFPAKRKSRYIILKGDKTNDKGETVKQQPQPKPKTVEVKKVPVNEPVSTPNSDFSDFELSSFEATTNSKGTPVYKLFFSDGTYFLTPREATTDEKLNGLMLDRKNNELSLYSYFEAKRKPVPQQTQQEVVNEVKEPEVVNVELSKIVDPKADAIENGVQTQVIVAEKLIDLFDDIEDIKPGGTRLATVEDFSSPLENVREVQDFFRKNLPQVDLNFTKEIIKLRDGKLAWGTFYGNAVNVFENAIKGTGYHEAFEVVFTGVLSKKEQNELLDEARNRKGTFKNFSTDNVETSYGEATNQQLIEELSEEFARFKEGINPPAPKQLNFFQRLLKFLRDLINNVLTIEKAFSRLNNAYYANKEIRSNVSGTSLKVAPRELKSLYNGFTYELLNEVRSVTNSFTYFDELDNTKVRSILNNLKNLGENFYNYDTKPDVRGVTFANAAAKTINLAKSQGTTEADLNNLKAKMLQEVQAKKDWWNNEIKPDWEEFAQGHLKFLKHIGVISTNGDFSLEEINEDDKDHDYTKNAFDVDTRLTAPRSVRLLFNSIAESMFDLSQTTVLNGVELPLIVNKTSSLTGMSEFYNNSKQLFNIVLSLVSETNDLDGMKLKLEQALGFDTLSSLSLQERFKALENKVNKSKNSTYIHLFKVYQRLFGQSFDELDNDAIRERLKVLSAFSKQTPTAEVMYVNPDGSMYLMNASRDNDRRNVVNSWLQTLTKTGYDKSNGLISKRSKRSPFFVDVKVAEALRNTNNTIQIANGLGFTGINEDLLNSINSIKRNELLNALKSFLEYLPSINKKALKKLTPENVGASGPLNTLADIYVSVNGDGADPVRTNLEGKQQQNTILNNTVSKMVSEMNLYEDRDTFLSENPHYAEFFNGSNNSLILDRLFNDNDRTKTKLKVGVLEGLRLSDDNNRNKKTSSQSPVERLIQEFNSNLQGTFYILVPADSETEWTLSLSEGNTKLFYQQYKDDLIEKPEVLEKFQEYLRSEIETTYKFINQTDERHLDIYLNTERKLFSNSEEVRTVGKSLQLFKDILPKELVLSIHEAIDQNVPSDDIVAQFLPAINEAIIEYLYNKIDNTFKELVNNQIVAINAPRTTFPTAIEDNQTYTVYALNSNFANEQGYTKNETGNYVLTANQLRDMIAFRELNYTFNNIESTKLFLGNPYFYKDFLKRVKSALSPKEDSYVQSNNTKFPINDHFNTLLNTVEGYTLPESHLHNHNFKNHINTWVFKDHETFNEFLKDYSKNNNVDAQSFYTLKGYREFKNKNGASFTPKQEQRFQVEHAYERILLDRDNVLPYTSKELQDIDKALVEPFMVNNELVIPQSIDVFEILKPLFFGPVNNRSYVHPLLLKTSIAPFSYRMVKGTPLASAYVQMLKNQVDVLTFESAIKVGAQSDTGSLKNLLDLNTFNTQNTQDLTSTIHELPFRYIGRQQETSTQKDKNTIGTQPTKLVPTDMYEHGVPTDWNQELSLSERLNKWYSASEEERLTSNNYRLEKEHNSIIQDLQDFGYYSLLDKLGVQEVTKDGKVVYKYEDLSKVYNILLEEMVQRGLSPNIYELLEDKSIAEKPLEALANYSQASYIILSLVRKSLIKPKLNGGQKVQMSSVLLNNMKDQQIEYFYKNKKDWKKVETEEEFNNLTVEQKKTLLPTSPQLKFYTSDGGKTTRMQVMLPNIYLRKINEFREKRNLPKLNDKQLLSWLKENQSELLNGIGFRIPTQALSSIDSFEIVGFLPDFMGDSIVVPSEITTKAGSDFDIDKLNTYLNNFRINSKGYPEMVPPMTYKEAQIFFRNEFIQKKTSELVNKQKFLTALDAYVEYMSKEGIVPIDDLTSQKVATFIQKSTDKLIAELDKFDSDEEAIEALIENVEQLDNQLSSEDIVKTYVNKYTKKAIENKYFSVMDEIVRMPSNFKKLLSPNNTEEFTSNEGIRNEFVTILGKEGNTKSSYLNYSQILDSNYMRELRHSFVAGKKGVGIAAIAATYHILSQKVGLRLNPSDTEYFSNEGTLNAKEEFDSIHLKHNTTNINGQQVSLLSGVTKHNGENIAEFISKYVNGYVDVAKDTWILDIGASLDIAGIFLFMERLGIDSKEIVYFLNQPIIKNYLNIKALKRSPLFSINPTVKAELNELNNDSDIYNVYKQKLLSKIGEAPDGKPIYQDTYVSNFSLNEMKTSIVKNNTYSTFSDFIKSLTDEEKNFQFRVFKQFMQLKEYSDYVREAKNAADHDTANINNLDTLDLKNDILDKHLQSAPLVATIKDNTPMALALRQETFIGNITKNYTNLDNEFLSKSVLKIDAFNIRKSIKNLAQTIDPTLYSKTDKEEMLRKLKPILINLSTFQQNAPFSSTKVVRSNMKVSILEEKLARLQSLSLNNTDLAKIADNKWLNFIEVRPVNPGSEFGFYAMKRGTRVELTDPFETAIWTSDLSVIKNLDTDLYRSIVFSAMISSGSEFNRESITQLIPWKDYIALTEKGVTNVFNVLQDENLARKVAQSKYFDTSIVPRVTYISSEGRGKSAIKPFQIVMPKNTLSAQKAIPFMDSTTKTFFETNTNSQVSSLLAIPSKAYTARYNYFTVSQRRTDYNQQEAFNAIKDGNFDYKAEVLFEKTNFVISKGVNDFIIFRPIQTKGARYFNDFTESPALISDVMENNLPSEYVNERINPIFEDDIKLEQLLNSAIKSNTIKGTLNRLKPEVEQPTERFEETSSLWEKNKEALLKKYPTMKKEIFEELPIEEQNKIVECAV